MWHGGKAGGIMYLRKCADQAAPDIEGQIAATKARLDAYVESGRRMMRLRAEIGHPCHG